MKKSTTFALLAAFAILAAGLTGCTTTADEPATAPTPTPTPSTSTAKPEPSESPAEEESVTLPPAPPAGTPAALAWEALMGPDGEYDSSANYLAVIEKFGQVEPYVSIQAAEERHIQALTRQLTRLGVETPENPYIGKIKAPDSLEAAALAWAEGEVANIAMYDRLLTQTDDAALMRVLTNLRSASANVHLPAFQAAAANGGTLTPEQMIEFQNGR